MSNSAPLWGCAGDLVEIVVEVPCGTVLGRPKQSHNALWQPSWSGLPRDLKVANCTMGLFCIGILLHFWVKHFANHKRSDLFHRAIRHNIHLGCVSLKKSKIGFLIRDHADSLFLKTRKIRKWIFFSIRRNDPSMQFACFGGSFQNGGKFWFDVWTVRRSPCRWPWTTTGSFRSRWRSSFIPFGGRTARPKRTRSHKEFLRNNRT